jgi:hypothetical protein
MKELFWVAAGLALYILGFYTGWTLHWTTPIQ